MKNINDSHDIAIIENFQF